MSRKSWRWWKLRSFGLLNYNISIFFPLILHLRHSTATFSLTHAYTCLSSNWRATSEKASLHYDDDNYDSHVYMQYIQVLNYSSSSQQPSTYLCSSNYCSMSNFRSIPQGFSGWGNGFQRTPFYLHSMLKRGRASKRGKSCHCPTHCYSFVRNIDDRRQNNSLQLFGREKSCEFNHNMLAN